MEDLTGKQLGPYRIEGPLGEGGMAAVYKAYQASMGRYVALKILPRHFAGDPSFVARFDQEARIIARLQHVHIVPVHDYGHAEGYTYLVMPFIPTGTLADVMRAGHLPLERVRTIILQVGEALGYAHAQGVIHRDVKPSNILVDDRANCRLTDFGIAKMVEGTLHLTQTGAMTGTPSYMSPEQITGDTLDGRSDLYSLGVILFEMATGRPPFLAETPAAVLVKHLHDRPPNPRAIRRDLAPALEKVILKSLAKAREGRYPDIASFVQAVKAAIPETPSRKPRVAAPAAAGTTKVYGGRSPTRAAATTVEGAVRRGPRRIALATAGTLTLAILGAFAAIALPAIVGRITLMGVAPSPDTARAASPTPGATSPAGIATDSDAPTPSPSLEPSPTPRPTQVSLTKDQVGQLVLHRRLDDVRAWDYQGSENLYVHFLDPGDRNQVNRFDPSTLEMVETIVVGVDTVQMSISPDGSRLMLLTSSGELALWNLVEGRAEWISEPLYSTVLTSGVAAADQDTSPSWSPDSRHFALVRWPGVAVWDSDDAEPLWDERFPGNTFNLAAWSPDSTRIALRWGSRTVLLDARTGESRAVLSSGVGAGVFAFAWNSDGSRLAVASGTRSEAAVEVWGTRDPDNPLHLGFRLAGVHSSTILLLAWSPDERLIASGSVDGTIAIWDPAQGAVARRLNPLAGAMSSVTWSPDGTLIAGGTFSGNIPVWEVGTWDLLAKLSERAEGSLGMSQRAVKRLIWLPDGAGFISFVDGSGYIDFLSLWAVPKP